MNKFIKTSLTLLIGATCGMVLSKQLKSKSKESENKTLGKSNKFRKYYGVSNRWILLKNEGVKLEKFFTDRGIKSIAIYGMGELGNRLLEELKASTSVEVKYGIDRVKGHTYIDFPIKLFSKSSDERYTGIDAIVVTAVFDMENIRKDLQDRSECQIISLEDVVFGL